MSQRASEYWRKWEIEHKGSQKGLSEVREQVRVRARNSPQQDSWAIIRQPDLLQGRPWRQLQASLSVLMPSSLSWKRGCGQQEEGRTQGLELREGDGCTSSAWASPPPGCSQQQKSALAVPTPWPRTSWSRIVRRPSVAGSLPKSSGRCTSQPGGKTGQTCASLSTLAALSVTGWQTHCSPERPAAGRGAPATHTLSRCEGLRIPQRHSREGASTKSRALPQRLTTPARSVCRWREWMKLAGCAGRPLFFCHEAGAWELSPWDRKAARMSAGGRSECSCR